MKLSRMDEIEVPLNDETRYDALNDIIGNQIACFALWNVYTDDDELKPLVELKAEYKEITDLLTWAESLEDDTDVRTIYVDWLETCRDEHENAIYEVDVEAYHEDLLSSLPKLPFEPKLDPTNV